MNVMIPADRTPTTTLPHQLDDELERALSGHPWHGTSLGAILRGVTATQASSRPIPNAHSIWELVLHLTAWAVEIERRLRETAQPLSGQQDWPVMESPGDASWQATIDQLYDTHQKLRNTVRNLSGTQLEQRLGIHDEAEGTFLVMLHGVSQHMAYHAGQIALLKKMVQ